MKSAAADRPLRDFRAALSSEALRMEPAVVKAGLILAAVALCVVLVQGALTYLHWDIAVLTGCMVAWQSVAFLLLRRDIGTRALAWVDPTIEALFPTLLVFADYVTRGGHAAAFVSPAPIVYMYSVLLAVVRLRPLVPLASGAVCATSYAALLHWLVLPAALAVEPISVDDQVFLYMRAAFLALGGAVGSFVVLALRRASGQAHRDVRAKELFGKYRIGEEVASGGMGVVMRATYCPEGGFERDVAMKRIHPHLMRDDQMVAAFRAEAELSARMLHPNIVQVLDFGRVDDTWFFAMEYVDGVTLHQLLKACRAAGQLIPLPILAYVTREVCAGLEYAHSGALGVDGQPLRVVHRDLTPSNILLARTGQVKIADFGVARALRGAAVLQTQTLAGKMPYMAPEQASGGPLDGRTDLFTLGVGLWESICGRTLFQRDSEASTLHAVLHHEVPPPSAVRPGVPKEWDAVVLKALAREPAQRFRSAHELAEALAACAPAGPADLAAYLAELAPVSGSALATPVRDELPTSATATAVTKPH